ncbi:hypothetical protein ANN_12353 [Periplaneta americana]|uniref:Uncharacterized protein n=1 Tax=Periplaneta americana TaxID=6978 RepID=A0ABQ8TIG5_PERAM|nr:hypothetical protein ANN_12353 [Periplaneta americana]
MVQPDGKKPGMESLEELLSKCYLCRFLWPSKVNVDICSSEKIDTFTSAHISEHTDIGQARFSPLIARCHGTDFPDKCVLRLIIDSRTRYSDGDLANRLEYYGKIMEVIDALDSTDSSAVAAVKSEQLLEDILFIGSNFKVVSKSITLLESSKLQLSKALNIVDKVSQIVIQNNNSLISEKVK